MSKLLHRHIWRQATIISDYRIAEARGTPTYFEYLARCDFCGINKPPAKNKIDIDDIWRSPYGVNLQCIFITNKPDTHNPEGARCCIMKDTSSPPYGGSVYVRPEYILANWEYVGHYDRAPEGWFDRRAEKVHVCSFCGKGPMPPLKLENHTHEGCKAWKWMMSR